MRANRIVALAIALIAFGGPVQAQQGEQLPPIPLSMMEQQGKLERVDVARSLVWISGASYRVTEATRAFAGSQRVHDLRELVVGSQVGFMDDNNGSLLTLWSATRNEPKGGGR